jgi:hypothetical protein
VILVHSLVQAKFRLFYALIRITLFKTEMEVKWKSNGRIRMNNYLKITTKTNFHHIIEYIVYIPTTPNDRAEIKTNEI